MPLLLSTSNAIAIVIVIMIVVVIVIVIVICGRLLVLLHQRMNRWIQVSSTDGDTSLDRHGVGAAERVVGNSLVANTLFASGAIGCGISDCDSPDTLAPSMR